MKRIEIIREMCSIMALAWNAIDPEWKNSCDGFCDSCPFGIRRTDEQIEPYYRNTGDAVKFVRTAVVEKIKRDGLKIARGWNPKTGEENT